MGTAKFVVDVRTGEVLVEALGGDPSAPAVFTGNGVSFLPQGLLINDEGGLGRKKLNVRIQNKRTEVIGSGGFGFRTVFSNFRNITGPLPDLRTKTVINSVIGTGDAATIDGTTVSAALNGASCILRGGNGELYISTPNDGKVRKVSGGNVTTIASGLVNPQGLALAGTTEGNPTILLIADPGQNDVFRVSVNGGAVTDATGAATFPDVQDIEVANSFSTSTGSQVALLTLGAAGEVRFGTITTSGSFNAASTPSVLTGLANPRGAAFIGGSFGSARFAITEAGGNRIRLVQGQPAGTAAIGAAPVIGLGTVGSANGAGSAATFNAPVGIVFTNNTLLITDTGNNMIRQATQRPGTDPMVPDSWFVSIIAGRGDGTPGFVDGPGAAARFNQPRQPTLDANGSLLVPDQGNNRIRQINPQGSTFPLGSGFSASTPELPKLVNQTGYLGSGANAVPYIDANRALDDDDVFVQAWSFMIPEGVTAFEFSVTLEAVQSDLASLRGVFNSGPGFAGGSPDVFVRTLSGSTSGGTGDGQLAQAVYNGPTGLAFDKFGNMFVADRLNHTIRRIDVDGTVNTIAGAPGVAGGADGDGSEARLSQPFGIAVVADGNVVYFTEAGNHTVRVMFLDTLDNVINEQPFDGLPPFTQGNSSDARFASRWTVKTIAGLAGSAGFANGPGATARFSGPLGLARSDGETLYLTEAGNRVRAVSHTSQNVMDGYTVTSVAGDELSANGAAGSTDGVGSAARFSFPVGIAISPIGDLYVADQNNHAVRRISGRTVTRVAGTLAAAFGDSNTGTAAKLRSPVGVAVDRSGVIFIAEAGQGYVRRLTPEGTVRTVAGIGTNGTVDGTGDTAGFTNLRGITVNKGGDVFVTEDHRIRSLQRIIRNLEP